MIERKAIWDVTNDMAYLQQHTGEYQAPVLGNQGTNPETRAICASYSGRRSTLRLSIIDVEVGELMTAELLALGLLDKADVQNQTDKNPAYKKYFMHGTSHHLGLDTHDYGLLDQPITANMVFTVEPGIYIPQEGFRIRLEDDVVVQQTG